MLQRHTIALAGLTAIILILTGSAVRSTASSPVMGVLAPVIVPALLTWYLIMVLAYSKTITEILAAFLLSRPKGEGGQRGLLGMIIAWAIVVVLVSLISRPEIAANIAGALQQTAGYFVSKFGLSPLASNTTRTPAPSSSTLFLFYYTVLVFVGIVVVSFCLLFVSFYKAYTGARAFPIEVGEGDMRKEMLQAVQQARAKLKASEKYYETILDCYKQMCRVLSDSGHSIQPTETPREFAQSVSKKLELGADSVLGLTFLFEEARYSNHRIGDEKKELAVNYLSSLEQVLLSVGVKA